MKYASRSIALASLFALCVTATSQAGWYSNGESIRCSIEVATFTDPGQTYSSKRDLSGFNYLVVPGPFTSSAKLVRETSLPPLTSMQVGTEASPELLGLARTLAALGPKDSKFTVTYDHPKLTIELELPGGEKYSSTVVRDVTNGAYHGGNRNQSSPQFDIAASPFLIAAGLPAPPAKSRFWIYCQ